MASSQGSGPGAPHNPTITEIEPVDKTIWPEHALGGVGLEIVDRTGSGFKTILDWPDAVDVALRLMAAVVRLRGITP